MAELPTPISSPPSQASVGPAATGLPNDAHATELIRQKVARIFTDNPDDAQVARQTGAVPLRSKHQQFMYDLSTSGKSLAAIQTEWHNYYVNLPTDQKYQVWQEFYDSSETMDLQPITPAAEAQVLSEHKHQAVRPAVRRIPKFRDVRSLRQAQEAIRDRVSVGGQLHVKHHLQSLLFGLGLGAIVLIIFLFSFFNEVVIAPFIQPGRVAAATPIILNASTISATATPEVIIPKINVQIPVNYTEISTNEASIENDLEAGVVHYPSTVFPGQEGNAAFFGHSSNNIFNPGKYKFAFVLLHTLVNGDTFYLTYNGKVYIYKVISHTIVPPSDVSVLGTVSGQTATATLITCDPPGTSINRLVVVGQQISPDPTTNTTAAPTAKTTSSTVATLPGNGPTFWANAMRTTIGKLSVVAVIALIIVIVGRSIKRYLNPREYQTT